MDTFEESYICISCTNEQVIKYSQPIICKQCYGRIFRKVRTAHRVIFTAR